MKTLIIQKGKCYILTSTLTRCTHLILNGLFYKELCMKIGQPKKDLDKKIPEQGNRTEGSKDYKDPVGSKDKISPPKNSGYDEKQPPSK